MHILDMVAAAQRDIKVLEKTVPAHMLVLMIEACMKKGFEVREDVLMHLNNAAVAPLARLDELTISRLAKRTDELAGQYLNRLAPDDPRDGLYCCVMFVLTLIDEGLWDDAKNQAVLVSLLFMEDVKDERKDSSGYEAVWAVDEHRWKQKAKDILAAAQLGGLYLKAPVVCN